MQNSQRFFKCLLCLMFVCLLLLLFFWGEGRSTSIHTYLYTKGKEKKNAHALLSTSYLHTSTHVIWKGWSLTLPYPAKDTSTQNLIIICGLFAKIMQSVLPNCAITILSYLATVNPRHTPLCTHFNIIFNHTNMVISLCAQLLFVHDYLVHILCASSTAWL